MTTGATYYLVKPLAAEGTEVSLIGPFNTLPKARKVLDKEMVRASKKGIPRPMELPSLMIVKVMEKVYVGENGGPSDGDA